jgi:phosphoribosylformimino-5-aminoimidazole carboxamide ribotide isomerase
MLIIPAIDIKNGKCVRLYKGEMDRETVYSADPIEVARRWAEMGAERLHVVDLDAAVTGQPKNFKIIRDILHTVKVPTQVGGGIRGSDTLQLYFGFGAEAVIFGTAAIENVDLLEKVCTGFPDRVYVGIDVKNGKAAKAGWTKTSEMEPIQLGERCKKMGATTFIYTDISRDGTREGVNVEATKNFAERLRTRVIASGGISSMDDIRELRKHESSGIFGAIIGRALYDGVIDLKEAIRVAKE